MHRADCRRPSAETFSAWSIGFAFSLYSCWTLLCHIATFTGISWDALNSWLLWLVLPLLLGSLVMAGRVARAYSTYLLTAEPNLQVPVGSRASLASILLLATMGLLFLGSYEFKFVVVLVAAPVLVLLHQAVPLEPAPVLSPAASKIALPLLVLLCAVAVVLVLVLKRTDLDDSSFLQIAAQTALHSNLAPLTYDASLGHLVEPFRFAPYRLSSYELLAALLVKWTGLNLLAIYYLVLPAIGAVLCILAAFLFARCFVRGSLPAVLAVLVFLLVILVWGETSTAYGNRLLVRLFQGKGLLIAVTTPVSLVAGLMLIRQPSLLAWSLLCLANVCAIGVSSSGLVLCVFVAALIFCASIAAGPRRCMVIGFQLFIALLYPMLLAFWMKFESRSAVSFSEIGTYLPIDASLGGGGRESIALAAMLGGFLVFFRARDKELALLFAGTLLVTLNPWLAELFAHFSSRNMSWRIAWAAPVPLLLSVTLVAILQAGWQQRHRLQGWLPAVPALGMALLFLFVGRTVFAPENNLSWGRPGAKIEPQYFQTWEIARHLQLLKFDGSVLAQREVAAWLPLTLPGVELVMPGHTYPIQLQTVLGPDDYAARMRLVDVINHPAPPLQQHLDDLRRYRVRLLIVSDATVLPQPGQGTLVLRELFRQSGYKVVEVDSD
ncbi:DUF6077 domain-containing protein [Pseudomonas citronellolis]|uniref:DUF6077 domain-containing protein n=1 Tax=Pseudomonas citronellolis TaxID=53408 RepID=UPI0023E4146B|nr:DUF6077 domain-containing protein [Pseudomonas citronellolis]MDF3931717.1 DUF6077 domain-containing protein [Pseudomonas citronellolis]